ncbi:MAG TPA: SUMF1/EgtB/PvdO family nonheme iron enzyme, partial [Polyangiaceae bacterium]|nr:SUMF1/EgtB/PvdO family nonheme iron enzyme [Polyangiaceae bacterium]
MRRLGASFGFLVLSLACRRELEVTPRGDVAPAPGPREPAEMASGTPAAPLLGPLLAEIDAGAHARERTTIAAKAGERVRIPAGRFVAGSQSGDEGRDPKLEPNSLVVDLAGYEIDRLPYPNDPKEPPRTDATLKDAAKLCAERGERLCSELEWEYACKGPAGDPFATGEAWDANCSREPATCNSGAGALGMGTLREWTASNVLPLEKDDAKLPAVRGAGVSAEPADHRCAHRMATSSTAHAKDLGFRCCAGPENAAQIPAPKLGPTARKIALEPSQLAEIFATIPQLASVRQSIRYFAEPDDTATVLRKGKTAKGPADPEGFTLTTSPLLWNPAPGDELIVALGRGAKDSFIVAL